MLESGLVTTSLIDLQLKFNSTEASPQVKARNRELDQRDFGRNRKYAASCGSLEGKVRPLQTQIKITERLLFGPSFSN